MVPFRDTGPVYTCHVIIEPLDGEENTLPIIKNPFNHGSLAAKLPPWVMVVLAEAVVDHGGFGRSCLWVTGGLVAT
ncbi:IclR family transcriptional regulator [Sesbania bispinosa]|nr:IclR family transcriptional regulator [Sesbania bispinosa]